MLHANAACSCLQAASLQRYRKVHKLNDVMPGSSKEELLPAVARHFNAQVSVHTLSSCEAAITSRWRCPSGDGMSLLLL
jgi:hypothetical protein